MTHLSTAHTKHQGHFAFADFKREEASHRLVQHHRLHPLRDVTVSRERSQSGTGTLGCLTCVDVCLLNTLTVLLKCVQDSLKEVSSFPRRRSSHRKVADRPLSAQGEHINHVKSFDCQIHAGMKRTIAVLIGQTDEVQKRRKCSGLFWVITCVKLED